MPRIKWTLYDQLAREQRRLREPVTFATRRPNTVSAHVPAMPRPAPAEPHANLVIDHVADLARAEMRFAAEQQADKQTGADKGEGAFGGPGIPGDDGWQPGGTHGTNLAPESGGERTANDIAPGEAANPGWVLSQPVHSSLADPASPTAGHDLAAAPDPMGSLVPGLGVDPFDPGGPLGGM